MKWVIGIVVLLVVVCGGLCAAGGGYYFWMSRGVTDVALPNLLETPDGTEATDGKVGVEACDAYIEKMSACLATMDPATKSAMESSFQQTTDAWRAAAATDAGKAGLEVGCKAALDAVPTNCGSAASATSTEPAPATGTEATTAPASATPAPATPAPATTTAPPTTAERTPPSTSSSPSTSPSTTTKPAASTTSPSTSSGSSTKPASATGTKPVTSTTTPSTSTKPAPTTTPSSTTKPTTSTTTKPAVGDDDPPPPSSSGDSKVAIGFVLPSGGKWDDLVVGVDGASLGKRPLRTRVTPGSHTFTFKTEGLDLSCPIDVGSSGRTIILDQKKKACPSKSG